MHTEGAVASLFFFVTLDAMTALALLRNENSTHKAVLLMLIFCWWAWPVGHLLEGVKCGPVGLRARGLACCFFFKLL